MSNGENKVLETDVVIFPIKFGNEIEEKVSDEAKSKSPETERQVSASDRKEVFGRLKKSLRKKSAGIL